MHGKSSTQEACEQRRCKHRMGINFPSLLQRSGPEAVEHSFCTLLHSKIIFKLVFLFSVVYFSARFWQVHRAFLYYYRQDILILGNNDCFIWNVWISVACLCHSFSKGGEGKIGGQLGSRWQSFISWHPFFLSFPPAKVNLWQMAFTNITSNPGNTTDQPVQ